jgi:hypothetical protein
VAKTFIQTKEPELKGQFDRIVCYAFSVSPQVFHDHKDQVILSFTPTETKITKRILASPEIEKVREAYASAEEGVVVRIGGRRIQYVPGMNVSGMTDFEENGFFIGRDAFKSKTNSAKPCYTNCTGCTPALTGRRFGRISDH